MDLVDTFKPWQQVCKAQKIIKNHSDRGVNNKRDKDHQKKIENSSKQWK